MMSRVSILPTEILDTLASEINEACIAQHRPSSLNLLRLPQPRTGLMALFLPFISPSGASVILELQNVAPNASRSWFNGGEVVSDGSMLLVSRIDPVFILVPILRAASPHDGSIGKFRTFDDLLEEASEQLVKGVNVNGTMEVAAGDILELRKLPCILDAMRRVCETKGESEVASDLIVFRYTHTKLLEYLVKKTYRLANGNFVEKSHTLERELAKDGLMEDGKEELLQSGKLKLACDLISQYVSPEIHEELLGKFDLTALTQHLAALKEADLIYDKTTSNSNVQKKQANAGQDKSNGKKRKSTGQESSGVTKLKKANIKGMTKLSAFFQKKT